jgi:hypothetical protein
MTSIGTVAFAPQIAAAAQRVGLGTTLADGLAAEAGSGLGGASARDAAIPELAATAASVNALQSLSVAPTSEDAAISAAMPVSPLPAPPAPQTSQQQARAEAPLTQDYYADAADDGDSKGA